MKYFSSESVANAYKGFQGSITNKSWGVLAIMHQLDSMIVPGRTYAVNCSSLSTYIEQLFCLGGKKSYIDNGKEWYVKFSTQWNDFFDKQGQTIPNIFDIIVWAYRTSPLPDDITHEKLLAMFAKDFHLSVVDINNTFDTREKRIEYNDTLYSDSNLLSIIAGKLGTSLSKNITADGKSVAASPGELSRGPFVQPLYAALDTSDYILVSQTNFDELYPIGSCRKAILPSTNDDNKYVNAYLTAIRTKPFILLAGISGTGKSRIVRKLAQATDDIDTFVNDDDRWKCSRPANFELIQVKPNWHNTMDVVGFQSNIPEPHYEFTPFVDFVVKAWCYEDTPFFLCLDEMNLAPVEEYFAEFLSAIESRSIGEDGEFETDPIIKPFDSFGSELAGKMMNHFIEMGYDLPKKVETRLREKGLTLPKNLIVMGTVNMDETTFSFSRKVLDRAMSIEMNEVDYDGFIEGKTEYNVPKLIEQNLLFVNRPISAQEVKNGIESQEVMNFLKGVNDILDGTPFKLGYRAANEAILYVAADKVVGADNLKAALDDFTLMKILSRIEGDDSKLVTKDGKKLLDELSTYLSNVFGTEESSKSLAKLENMIRTLKRDHFVSFWG